MVSSKTIHGANKKRMLKYTFQPENPDYPRYMVASRLPRGGIDYYIKAEPLAWSTDGMPHATCTEVVGKVNECNYESIIADKFNLMVRPKPKYDLQDTTIVFAPDYDAELMSIDPAGCRDIDDVLGWKRTDDYTEVSVHIAHVTQMDHPEFVHRQSTTIYPPTMSNYNLLPDVLAEGTLSLLPGIRRNVISLIIRWEGDTMTERLQVRSIVNSRALTYEEAPDDIVYCKLKHWIEDYLFSEYISDSHEVVERLMIYANVAVAKRLSATCPRNTVLRTTAPGLACPPALYMLCSDCELLDRPTRHSYLDKEYYTHFTSPIRRAADQEVHLALRRYVLNEEIETASSTVLRSRLRTYNCRSAAVRRAEAEWFWLEAHKREECEFEAQVTNVQHGNIVELFLKKYEKRATVLWCCRRVLSAADSPECPWKPGDMCTVRLFWDTTMGLAGKTLQLV